MIPTAATAADRKSQLGWDTNTALLVIVLGSIGVLVVMGHLFADVRVSATA